MLDLIDSDITSDGLSIKVIAVIPRLLSADKVHDLDALLELLVSWRVRVGRVRGHVVDEWETSRRFGGRPAGEEGVQQALIATVEAASGDGERQEARVGLERRTEHEHAGVEAVWPADVGRRGQLLAVEQVVDVLQHQTVGVEEDGLFELSQAPAVKLRERHAEFRSLEKR